MVSESGAHRLRKRGGVGDGPCKQPGCGRRFNRHIWAAGHHIRCAPQGSCVLPALQESAYCYGPMPASALRHPTSNDEHLSLSTSAPFSDMICIRQQQVQLSESLVEGAFLTSAP